MKIGKKLDKEGYRGRAPLVPPLDPLMYWLINQVLIVNRKCKTRSATVLHCYNKLFI